MANAYMVPGKPLKHIQPARKYEGKIDYEEVELDCKKLADRMGIRVANGQAYIELSGNMGKMD